MMHIDKTIFKVQEFNHYKTESPKTQIVIGSSMRKSNYHIVRLQHKDFGKTKRWNTYTITRDGVIYQHYDPKYHSDFMGIKEGDKQSISIVLENMGYLIESPSGKYINWLDEECDGTLVGKKKWLGYNYWEKYSKEQIENCAELCRQLCDEFGIPKVVIDFRNYHKDIVKFRGIVFRSNYFEDSNDINPLIDINKLNELVNK
jgi:hypothetical protein